MPRIITSHDRKVAKNLDQLFKKAKDKDPTLTWRKLAEALGKTPGFISQLRHGHTALNTENTLRIAQILRCDPTDIDPELKDLLRQQQQYRRKVPILDTPQRIEAYTSSPHTFALRIENDQLSPYIQKGWMILVNPDIEPLPSELYFIETSSGLLIGELTERNGRKIITDANKTQHIVATSDIIRCGTVESIIPTPRPTNV